MKFETYLLLLFLIYGIFGTRNRIRESKSTEERSFVFRATILTWFIGTLMLAAFIFLPNKLRVLMLIPAFLTVSGLSRMWSNARTRLRQQQQQPGSRVDIDRMKRVNHVREV